MEKKKIYFNIITASVFALMVIDYIISVTVPLLDPSVNNTFSGFVMYGWLVLPILGIMTAVYGFRTHRNKILSVSMIVISILFFLLSSNFI